MGFAMPHQWCCAAPGLHFASLHSPCARSRMYPGSIAAWQRRQSMESITVVLLWAMVADTRPAFILAAALGGIYDAAAWSAVGPLSEWPLSRRAAARLVFAEIQPLTA